MTGRARNSVGMIVAGACLTLAACSSGGMAAPGTPSSSVLNATASGPATSSSPPEIPSALAGPEQPAGACPYVTKSQVERVLAQRVDRFRGCVYWFADGRGIVGIGTYMYSSVGLARECLAQQRQSVGLGASSRPIPNLGPSAESVVSPTNGTVAILLRGAKMIVVGITWPPAARHPELAVTLLRDAAANFNSYSNTPQREC